MIPGSDLLSRALRVIAKQSVLYYQFISRSVNDIGMEVATYADPITIVGSFQPVPRRLYQEYGLDLTKSYFTLYTSNNIITTTRDVSGDQISFNGQRFQCEANVEWFDIDGWTGVLSCLITS